MANFGFSDLMVVDPWEPTWREAKAAVGAADVMAAARAVATIDEALADRSFVIGSTAATGRALRTVASPEAVFQAFGTGGDYGWHEVVVLFGNEKRGLTRDELDRCHAVLRIPTCARQPSMNLGQAVAICCYEARRHVDPATVSVRLDRVRGDVLATMTEVEHVLVRAVPVATDPVEERQNSGARARLRTLLLRARATRAEVSLLEGVLARRS